MTDEPAPQPQSPPGPAPGWTVGPDGTWVPTGWTDQPAPVDIATSAGGTTTSGPAPAGSVGLPWTAADPDDGRPRRGRRGLAAGLAAALVVAAVATGTVLGLGGSGKSANAAVVDAVDSTMADRTAQMSLTATVAAGTKTVKETGSGAVDFSQNAGQFTMTIGVDGQVVPTQVRFLGGIEYVEVPTIGQELPGKSWLSINLSSVESGLGSAATAGGTPTSPAAMLHMLAQNGNTVAPIGSSTIDGVPVQGYSVTASPAAIKAEMAKANLPSWMRAAMAHVSLNGLASKVYVDDQGLVRSIKVTTTESVASTTVKMDITLGFSGYGTTTVDVTAPTPAQVVTVGQLAQAGGSGSATSGPSGAATAT
jgi:hypothetical protein